MPVAANKSKSRTSRKGLLPELLAKAKREKWLKYVKTEADERAVLAGCYVDESRGHHVCQFFERYLRHSKGEWAGKPFVLAPVQRDAIIIPAYGWLQEDGRRRFRNLTIFVPQKNFKSTLCAGLSLYGLIGDGEPGAEVYSLANDREQASIIFRQSADMVEASPELAKRLVVTRSNKTITYGNASWQKALSAEIAVAEGKNAHLKVIDEIHVFDARGRRLYEASLYWGAARRQPLTIVISTAGDDETGIGYEVYSHAKSILAGTSHDTSTFAYIAEAERDDNPGLVATWRKANPMWGTTIQQAEVAASYEVAKESPRALAVFKRRRLNIWTQTAEPWLNMDHWNACDAYVDPDAFAGCECGLGLDLATKSDLAAVALCFPNEDDTFYSFLVHFWLPAADIARKEERDRCDYREWAEQGWLTLTEGNATKFAAIQDYIIEANDKYVIKEAGYDPWSAEQMAQNLQDRHGVFMVKMQQIMSVLAGPSKRFETVINEHHMAHGGNPILRRQAQYVCCEEDHNANFRPIKVKAKSFHRIDGIIACVMALGRAMSMAEARIIESPGWSV